MKAPELPIHPDWRELLLLQRRETYELPPGAEAMTLLFHASADGSYYPVLFRDIAPATATPPHPIAEDQPSEYQLVRLVHQLKAQVAELRQELREFKAERASRDERPLLAVTEPKLTADPYHQWIEKNLDELARFPDQFVAIDAKRGLVLHSADEDDFERQLGELYEREPDARERLLVTHTSLYV
jgi:hypothetical protein